MYWGDTILYKIETAYTNGTGRRLLWTESVAHYYAFLFHDGGIYITDWVSKYVYFYNEQRNRHVYEIVRFIGFNNKNINTQ